MKNRIEIRAEREWMRNSIALHLFTESSGDGVGSVAKPIEFMTVEEGELFGEPLMRLKMDQAQQLMDELWRAGLRPTEGTGSAGAMAATERHLKDMQTIVMHSLKINQKGAA